MNLEALTPYLSYIGLGLGLLARTVGMWLATVWVANFKNRKSDAENEPIKWDTRYLYGQLVAFILMVLALPLLIPDMSAVLDLSLYDAFVYAFGVASAGREIDKLFLG
jgi:hypothetical protein